MVCIAGKIVVKKEIEHQAHNIFFMRLIYYKLNQYMIISIYY